MVPEQDMVGAGTAPVAVGKVGWPSEATPPDTAILANAMHGLNHHRSLPNTLGDRRQLPGFDQLCQLGRLIERGREPGRVGNHHWPLQFANQGVASLGDRLLLASSTNSESPE